MRTERAVVSVCLSVLSPLLHNGYNKLCVDSRIMDYEKWFYSKATRTDAEKMLTHAPNGAFMVRCPQARFSYI